MERPGQHPGLGLPAPRGMRPSGRRLGAPVCGILSRQLVLTQGLNNRLRPHQNGLRKDLKYHLKLNSLLFIVSPSKLCIEPLYWKHAKWKQPVTENCTLCEPVRMEHPEQARPWRRRRVVVARGGEDLGGRSEVTVKRCGVSFRGDEDVL